MPVGSGGDVERRAVRQLGPARVEAERPVVDDLLGQDDARHLVGAAQRLEVRGVHEARTKSARITIRDDARSLLHASHVAPVQRASAADAAVDPDPRLPRGSHRSPRCCARVAPSTPTPRLREGDHRLRRRLARSDTARELEEAAAGRPGVKLVRHEQNRGKGAAIRTALEQATGDYVLIQDADLEYDVADYPRSSPRSRRRRRRLRQPVPRATPPRRHARCRTSSPTASSTATANVLYGTVASPTRRPASRCSAPISCARSTSSARASSSAPRSPPRSASAASRSSRCRSRTTARTFADGKKVRWTDGVEAMWVLVDR